MACDHNLRTVPGAISLRKSAIWQIRHPLSCSRGTQMNASGPRSSTSAATTYSQNRWNPWKFRECSAPHAPSAIALSCKETDANGRQPRTLSRPLLPWRFPLVINSSGSVRPVGLPLVLYNSQSLGQLVESSHAGFRRHHPLEGAGNRLELHIRSKSNVSPSNVPSP